MSGLDFIAQAVAHLESVEEKSDKLKVPAPGASSFSGSQPRYVSVDNGVPVIKTNSPQNTKGGAGNSLESLPPQQPPVNIPVAAAADTPHTATIGTPSTHPITGSAALPPMPQSQPVKQSAPLSTPFHASSFVDQEQMVQNGAMAAVKDHANNNMLPVDSSSSRKPNASIQRKQPAFTLTTVESDAPAVTAMLAAISNVTNDLKLFFSCMEKLCNEALSSGEPPAGIPKPDEQIQQVQKNDVLLGRGGETNHHIGNIRYRQLVKACQCAYLAAKRRDKPRIAAAIVKVVRARSGRFLKKKAGAESSWADVGSVRAREKTSQALREGAPELRGRVNVPLAVSHMEMMKELQRQKFPNNVMRQPVGPLVIPPPYYRHPQMVSTGMPPDMGHAAVAAPPPPPPPPLSQDQTYCNRVGVVVGKHTSTAVTAESSPLPNKKRKVVQTPKVVPIDHASSNPQQQQHCLPPSHDKERRLGPTTISAEDDESEEERARSPSSTESSKGGSRRGPRMKLLKQRMRDDSNNV